MSSKMLKALGALLIVGGAGSALATDLSPAYIGADVGSQFDGKNSSLVRVYGGYNVGSNELFGKPQVHALELMAFTLRSESTQYRFSDFSYIGGDAVRANGIGVNWTSALRLDDNWALTGRLGGQYAWATTRYRFDSPSDRYERGGVTAGLGLAYRLNPHVSLTLDLSYMPIHVNRYEKNDKPTLGTGLRYNF